LKVKVFEEIIRKVIREEIDYSLKRELSSLKEEINKTQPIINEVRETPTDSSLKEELRAKIKSQMPPPNFNTGNNTLNSLLTHTAMTPSTEEVFNQNDPVNDFLNKDYSQLMEAIDKKKNYRP